MMDLLLIAGLPTLIGALIIVSAIRGAFLARRKGLHLLMAEILVALVVSAAVFLHVRMILIQAWPTYLFLLVIALGGIVQFALGCSVRKKGWGKRSGQDHSPKSPNDNILS